MFNSPDELNSLGPRFIGLAHNVIDQAKCKSSSAPSSNQNQLVITVRRWQRSIRPINRRPNRTTRMPTRKLTNSASEAPVRLHHELQSHRAVTHNRERMTLQKTYLGDPEKTVRSWRGRLNAWLLENNPCSPIWKRVERGRVVDQVVKHLRRSDSAIDKPYTRNYRHQ